MVGFKMVVGGVQSTNAFGAFHTAACSQLGRLNSHAFSPAVDEIGVMFHISGAACEYEPPGLHRVRRDRVRRRIVAYWNVPKAAWASAIDAEIIRESLHALNASLVACLQRLEHDGDPVYWEPFRREAAAFSGAILAALRR
jgi:hypothetical protein